MRIQEAKAIAANPGQHTDKLKLARLKLEVAALRAYPASPRQQELRELIKRIEALPRELWDYHP
jgi:hypothetical protein